MSGAGGPGAPVRVLESPRGRVVVVADPEAVARAAAAAVVAATARADPSRTFAVALAGGATPRAMNRLLAGPLGDPIDWARLEFFFGDERCVGPEDPDSNYRMNHETLLGPRGVAAARVHRMEGELAPEDAARRYAARLARALERPFDLVLLGMGADGHTASLFPGARVLCDADGVVAAVEVPGRPAPRLTLTAARLSRAEAQVVSVAGAEKAAALALAIQGPSEAVPIQRVGPRPGRTTWIVDEAAAASL